MKICAIDVHHHYVPKSLLEEAKEKRQAPRRRADRERRTALAFFRRRTAVRAPSRAAGDRRAAQDDGRTPSSPWPRWKRTPRRLGYRLTGEQGENWCNVYNDGIADLVKRYPDRFVGMASVPLQDPARAAKVLERAVRDLNFRGGYIGTNVNGNYYGTDGVRSVLGQSARTRRHGRHASGRRRRRRQDESLRLEIDLRQSRRQRALLWLS